MTVKYSWDSENSKKLKHNTCLSSGDGEDIASLTGAQIVLGKHANVVCWGVHLYYCGLCLVSAEVDNCLCVIPWGCEKKKEKDFALYYQMPKCNFSFHRWIRAKCFKWNFLLPLTALYSRQYPEIGLSPSNPGVHKREIVLSLTSFNSTTGGSGGTKRHTADTFSKVKQMPSFLYSSV